MFDYLDFNSYTLKITDFEFCRYKNLFKNKIQVQRKYYDILHTEYNAPEITFNLNK